jgi:hypothetical protein
LISGIDGTKLRYLQEQKWGSEEKKKTNNK